MKTYTIEIEDTISETLMSVSEILGKPIEVVMSDVIFNQADKLLETITDTFTVSGDK